MVLADELAVGTLDVRWRSIRSHTQSDVGISEPILSRPARLSPCSTTCCRSQQRFQLGNISFGQSHATCNSNEHRVFFGVDLSVGGYRHALQL